MAEKLKNKCCEGDDFTMNELADEIQYALEEIGFYK